MARIRTVKPELFHHEELFDLEIETGLPIRFSWVGLFTCCDREGRFKWRPRQLKSEILPFDDVDFARVLDALFARGFVLKYRVDSEDYGYIPSWIKHQVINNREKQSVFPAPLEAFQIQPVDACTTELPRAEHASVTEIRSCQEEGKGKEGKGREETSSIELSKVDSSQVAGTLPLNDGTEYQILKSDEALWKSLYPAVDIHKEFRNMKGWLTGSPTRRKTKNGIKKFINSWLSRAQDAPKAPKNGNGAITIPTDYVSPSELARRESESRQMAAKV